MVTETCVCEVDDNGKGLSIASSVRPNGKKCVDQ